LVAMCLQFIKLTFPYADFDLPPYGFSTHTL
jgi:hypothetical protein